MPTASLLKRRAQNMKAYIKRVNKEKALREAEAEAWVKELEERAAKKAANATKH